jgi:hypothetical protein
MLADVLHVQQPSIAKMEKRTDMYLQRCATTSSDGGELEVIARFPDGAVKISNFAELGAPTQASMTRETTATWLTLIKELEPLNGKVLEVR